MLRKPADLAVCSTRAARPAAGRGTSPAPASQMPPLIRPLCFTRQSPVGPEALGDQRAHGDCRGLWLPVVSAHGHRVRSGQQVQPAEVRRRGKPPNYNASVYLRRHAILNDADGYHAWEQTSIGDGWLVYSTYRGCVVEVVWDAVYRPPTPAKDPSCAGRSSKAQRLQISGLDEPLG